MKYVIFYSWQSDLPNKKNRTFIGDSIEKSIKEFLNEENFEINLSLDRDTQGLAGAPDIVDSIFKKIKSADVFVADISMVTGDKTKFVTEDETKMQRRSPNPNVLLELGYAIAILGWEKIILVYNTEYGTDEDIPFDLRQRRRIPYFIPNDESKSDIKKVFISKLKNGISEILQSSPPSSHEKVPNISASWKHLKIFRETDFDNSSKIKNIEDLHISDTVILQPIPFNIEDLDKEIENTKITDGSADPEWDEKLKKYLKSISDFKTQIATNKTGYENFLIRSFEHLAKPITAYTKNSGNCPATEIKIEINLPDWIIPFENFPQNSDTIVKPYPPRVESPVIESDDLIRFRNMSSMMEQANRSASLVAGFRSVIPYKSVDSLQSIRLSSIKESVRETTKACRYSRKEKTLKISINRLLHKHSEADKDNFSYLIAMPNAPMGTHKLQARVFSLEFSDWKEIDIFVEVQKYKPIGLLAFLEDLRA